MITFQKITDANVRECIKLETYEEQNKFVAKQLYASLGFVEGEIEDGEQVAILRLL